jgi:hypothetical protein
MSEWVLILTMVMSQDFGSALETRVFTSENTCVAAGEAWIQQVRERMQGDPDDVAQFLCVPR